MITDERENRLSRIAAVADRMMTAGRTAPKAKGNDNLEIITLTGEDIVRLADATREEGERRGLQFLLRDADNILKAGAVILVGGKTVPQGLNCSYCGYATCAEKGKHPEKPCAVNSVDLGIAVGSMVSVAADLRVDTRVMFSLGLGARKIGLLPECHSIYAIPISVSSKSPFFDRG